MLLIIDSKELEVKLTNVNYCRRLRSLYGSWRCGQHGRRTAHQHKGESAGWHWDLLQDQTVDAAQETHGCLLPEAGSLEQPMPIHLRWWETQGRWHTWQTRDGERRWDRRDGWADWWRYWIRCLKKEETAHFVVNTTYFIHFLLLIRNSLSLW